MNFKVVSYSMTGNNEALARSVAAELGAEHIMVTEPGPRTMGTIAADMMFNRTPRIDQSMASVTEDDMVVLMGPVWMGHVASPLRACLKQLRGRTVRYAFCSISGGADGPNPKLERDLAKRAGRRPVALVDLHIADLLPPEPRPTRQDTQDYRLSDTDVRGLTDAIVGLLREAASRGGRAPAGKDAQASGQDAENERGTS